LAALRERPATPTAHGKAGGVALRAQRENGVVRAIKAGAIHALADSALGVFWGAVVATKKIAQNKRDNAHQRLPRIFNGKLVPKPILVLKYEGHCEET
jgi:hypothetical protein